MFRCTKCGAELTDKNWYPSFRKKHSYICKTCQKQIAKQCYEAHKQEVRQRDKQYYEDHKKKLTGYKKKYFELHKEKYKERHLIRFYGITLDDFNQMLESQNYKCAICGKEFSKDNKPCIDHNHKTGKVRALLCRNCNVAIGMLNDSPSIAYKAGDYLREHSG